MARILLCGAALALFETAAFAQLSTVAIMRGPGPAPELGVGLAGLVMVGAATLMTYWEKRNP
jgi:hypothetical protein